jgi:imidazolonepropionase-like amidohydrolase
MKAAPLADLALVGGTIHPGPGDEVVHNGTVLLRAGVIAAVGHPPVPSAVERIDCSGCAVIAGLWNSHVHLFERMWAGAEAIPPAELARQLRDAFTAYGFTSVFDTGSMWANTRCIRDRIESGEVPGPRIRSTGEGLLPPGGMPSDIVLGLTGVMKFPAPEIADPAQAAAAARKLLEDGVDGVKLFLSTPRSGSLPENAVRAAVDVAHDAGKPAFVHPNSGADLLVALRAGVDVIAHTTPHSGPWDAPILTAIAERQAALTPTLGLWNHFARHERVSARERIAVIAAGQLRAWIEAGGTVLFGTDMGAVDPDPSPEYASMSEAGMTFTRLLASLTTAPAERFGESQRLGRIAPGFQADIAIFEGDPSRDIRALAKARYTVRAGKVVHPTHNGGFP